MEIKAIETKYKGCRFRSRLEARWAVFFDKVGIKYRYETEGFRKGKLCYLPDFYLPDEDMYVEVKPLREGSSKDIGRASEFLGEKIKTLLLLPDIPDDADGIWFFPVLFRHPVMLVPDYKFIPIMNDESIGEVCLIRDWNDPVPEDPWDHRSLFWLDKKGEYKEETVHYLLTPQFLSNDWLEQYSYDTDKKIREYYTKARSARFEHGEKG